MGSRDERGLGFRLGFGFPHHLDDDLSPPRPDVELHKHDLLPGAEGKDTPFERDGKARTYERCLNVGPSVVVVPRLLMIIVDVFRRNPLQHPWEVPGEPGLELDGGDGCSGAGNKDCRHPSVEPAFFDGLLHLSCYVEKVIFGLCAQFEMPGEDGQRA